jgi:hypothetical protein
MPHGPYKTKMTRILDRIHFNIMNRRTGETELGKCNLSGRRNRLLDAYKYLGPKVTLYYGQERNGTQNLQQNPNEYPAPLSCSSNIIVATYSLFEYLILICSMSIFVEIVAHSIKELYKLCLFIYKLV